MALWYYLQKGRPQGPVTTEDIKKEIADGHLGAHDLVYRDRDTNWREVVTFLELQGHFQARPAEPSAEEWVLLVRKTDSTGYRQRGPFTTSQILNLLRAGEISFTDYVWRKGLKEWYKILALPELHKPITPQKSAPPPLPKEPEIPQDLSEITMKLPMPEIEAEPPQEAVVPGRAASPAKAKPGLESGLEAEPESEVRRGSAKKHVKRSAKAKLNSVQLARRISLINYYLDLSAVKKVFFIAGVMTSIGLGLVLLTYTSSFLDRRNAKLTSPRTPHVNSNAAEQALFNVRAKNSPEKEKSAALAEKISDVAETTAPVDVAPSNNAESSAEKRDSSPVENKDVKAKPTYLRYAVISDGTENASLKIISDGSRHYPIAVTFESEGGQVLNVRSVQRKLRISRLEERHLNVSRTGLPPGYYEVQLESEGMKVPLKLNFSTHSADFRKKLYSHRKRLVYFHNDERFNFLKTVGRLEKETYKLAQNIENASHLTSWKNFYRSWRKNFERIQNPIMRQISPRNRNNYVHAGKWLRMKALQAKVDADAKALNKSKMKGQAIDATLIKSSALELAKLKEQMLQESLF